MWKNVLILKPRMNLIKFCDYCDTSFFLPAMIHAEIESIMKWGLQKNKHIFETIAFKRLFIPELGFNFLSKIILHSALSRKRTHYYILNYITF